MQTPAQRFTPVPVDQRATLGLWLPPDLTPASPTPDIDDRPGLDQGKPDQAAPPTEQPEAVAVDAVEIERAAHTLRLEATVAHVVIDGALTRTVPLTLSPTRRAGLLGARVPGPAPELDHRSARG